LEKHGHELIVTSDKDGPNSEFEKHLPVAEVSGSNSISVAAS
jgi:formate dehydrogenase